MKATLPIPEQDGFRTRLADTVMLSPGTQARETATGLSLRRHGVSLAVQLEPQARHALLKRLNEGGDGLSTGRIATTWRQLLERLANLGMLVAARSSVVAGTVPALNALSAVFDAIHAESEQAFQPSHPLNRMICGELATGAGRAWLIENYHYTKSASWHISPVLEHPMETEECELWRRFLKDESWHWRIYRPALAGFGLAYRILNERAPQVATERFVEVLRSAAVAGPTVYAAVMTFIERPPLNDLASDPLFGCLTRHYGFTEAGIRPLWWHATENLTAGHSDLGAAVITRRSVISEAELTQMLAAVRATVREVARWNAEVLRPYLPPAQVPA